MRIFRSFERWTTGLAMTGAIAFLILAACLAFYQVVTRFVFDQPSTWSEVVTRSAMIWAVFLGVAPAFRQGSMIAVEMVQAALPPRPARALFCLAYGLSILFFLVLLWQGIGMTGRVARQTLAGVEVSIAWVYVALPVGAVFTLIALAGCLVRELSGEEHRSDPAPEAY
ncbi:TRAP transporter small permease (plasmid) [Paroceanicella profunda]|uniref:TRAP transporter small permease protein n=1 Tax=Paroceanicella profunda TaxID=2579971 RepID=A0A5B8FJF3_9RHOB|nr:TRAP transporter small permease [Paroceanicella profunda]QDL94248.1 TRAP transporter small permease [Paroceanicella profunda]